MVVLRYRDYSVRKLNMLHCTQPPQPPQALDVMCIAEVTIRYNSRKYVQYQRLAEVAEVAEVKYRSLQKTTHGTSALHCTNWEISIC